MQKESYCASLAQSLLALDADKVKELVEEGLERHISAVDIITHGLVVGLREMGEKFEQGEMFIPHLMVAAEITEKMTEFLKPHLKHADMGEKKKVVICTVEGDVHELGKNLVATMLSISNYEVVDLGRDVPNAKVIKAVKEERPDFLYLSALMTTTMMRQQEIIEALNREGMRDDVWVVVGGAPISQQWCDRIGADGYGMDAVEAVHVANRLSTR